MNKKTPRTSQCREAYQFIINLLKLMRVTLNSGVNVYSALNWYFY